MKKTLILLAIALAIAHGNAQAQDSYGMCQVGFSCSTNLTAQSTTCGTVAGSCVTLPIVQDSATSVIVLGGTFSGTVQFEASADSMTTWQAISGTPTNSTTTVTSATGAGQWRFAVAGVNAIRARCSTYSSGIVNATITGSRGSPALGGGSGGGGGGSGGSITGSGLTAYDVYYFGASGLATAEANSSSTLPALCVASTTTTCITNGTVTNGSWTWTEGGVIYLSDGTTGTMTQTAPSTSGHFVQVIGVATSATSMYVMPSLDYGTIQ
jgi:hypothetical protein